MDRPRTALGLPLHPLLVPFPRVPWLFSPFLAMAALLPATTTTIGIALVIDAVACIVLLQGVIYGIRLIHSEDVRERNR